MGVSPGGTLSPKGGGYKATSQSPRAAFALPMASSLVQTKLAAAARSPVGGERVTRSSRGGQQAEGGEEEEAGLEEVVGLDDSEALKGREALLRKVPHLPRVPWWPLMLCNPSFLSTRAQAEANSC